MPTRTAFLSLLAFAVCGATADAQPLPGTKPLDWDGDLAAKMVGGIDKYLSRELEAAPKKREAIWKPCRRWRKKSATCRLRPWPAPRKTT